MSFHKNISNFCFNVRILDISLLKDYWIFYKKFYGIDKSKFSFFPLFKPEPPKSFNEFKFRFLKWSKEKGNFYIFVMYFGKLIVGCSFVKNIRKIKTKNSHDKHPSTGIYVLKGFRNIGVASFLMKVLLYYLKKKRVKKVYATVSTKNYHSLKLHKSIKFINTNKKIKRFFYVNKKKNNFTDIILERKIIQ